MWNPDLTWTEIIEETADNANVDAASFKTLDTQPEKLSEGEFPDINEASGCDEKYKDSPEEVAPVKNSTLKELLEIFHDTEKSKGKNVGSSSKLRKEYNSLSRHRQKCSFQIISARTRIPVPFKVLLILKKIFIGIYLLSNVRLISTMQQSELAIGIHMSPLLWISFLFRSPQNND